MTGNRCKKVVFCCRNKGCKKCTNDFFTSDAGATGCSKSKFKNLGFFLNLQEGFSFEQHFRKRIAIRPKTYLKFRNYAKYLKNVYLGFFPSDHGAHSNCDGNCSVDSDTTNLADGWNFENKKYKIKSTVAEWQEIRQIWSE